MSYEFKSVAPILPQNKNEIEGESSKKLLKFENEHLDGIIINKEEHVMEFIRNVGTKVADDTPEVAINESLLEKYRTQIKTLLLNEEILSISQLNEDKLMKFFDFFMSDWRFRGKKFLNHDLIVKNDALTEVTHSNIVHHMIDLLKTKEKSLYHHVAYNILIQFIYEKVEQKQTIVEFRLDFDDLKRHLDGIDDEYLQYILLVLTYHSHPDDYQPHTNEKYEWLELLEYLKRGHFSKFEKLFKKLLNNEKCKYESYHEVSFKPLARFYYEIAITRNFTSVVELIFRSFPHVGDNSCLITSFHEQRNLWIIDNDAKYNFQYTNVYKPIIHYRVCRGLLKLGLKENFRDGVDIMLGFVKCKNSEILRMLDQEVERCPFMKDEIDEITKTFKREDLLKFDTLTKGFMRSLYHDMQIDSENKNMLVIKILDAMNFFLKLDKTSCLTAIMGRNSERPENLLEILLSIPQITNTIGENIIVDIWEKFELFNTPEILNSKNNRGLTLFDYAIESNDPRNLLTLIQCSEYYELFNSQCQEKLEINLFEYYIKISITQSSDEEMKTKFYSDVIMSLLEVLDTDKLPLESIFKLAKDKEICKTLRIDSEVYEGVLLEAKFNIDFVLCMMVGYMKSEKFLNGQKNTQMKEKLKMHHPIFNMIFMILENDEDEFVNTFEENVNLTENHILENYSEQEDTSIFLASFKYTMFIPAMINNRTKIIDKIFESENFGAVKIALPKNMKKYEGSHYAAMKLFESGHGNMIGKDGIPIQWMIPKLFEDFLDSRMKKTNDDNRIEIDTTFLIHSNNSRYNVRTKEDVDDESIFCDDSEALDYICRIKWRKGFLTHPAIATYVDLKWFKYKRIFFWNFFIYVLALISYVLYVMAEIGAANDKKDSAWCFGCQSQTYRIWQTCCVVATLVFLGFRELFQLYAINGKKHFDKISNIAETILIVSISLSMLFNWLEWKQWFIYLSCPNIFLMVAILITMFPYSFMFIHMQLLRKAAATFAKFLLTFITLLFSYVLIFGIIFDLANLGISDTENDVMTKFKNIDSTSSKVLMMLSGEFGVEPHNLSRYQMIVFMTFVIISYILFNLILALTIDDAQRMQKEAERIKVETKLEKIRIVNTYLRKFYFRNSQWFNGNKTKWRFEHLKYRFLKFLVSRYTQLHTIDKVFINLDTREVEILLDCKYTPFVKYSLIHMDLELFSISKSLKIEDEVYSKTLEIIKKRENNESELKQRSIEYLNLFRLNFAPKKKQKLNHSNCEDFDHQRSNPSCETYYSAASRSRSNH